MSDQALKVMPIGEDVLSATATGSYYSPHSILGMHAYEETTTFRALKPFADAVAVKITSHDGSKISLDLTHEHDGIFAGAIDLPSKEIKHYHLAITWPGGASEEREDPYRFQPTLGELDLHLIQEGRHEELWRALGARVLTVNKVKGTRFAIWAPNAKAVQVIGDFNGWNGRQSAMRSLGSSGVWEIFIPQVYPGAVYKFRILGADSIWREKADPLARQAEIPPATGSIVCESNFEWSDSAYLADRAASNAVNSRMSIYEVHLASWRPFVGYRQLAEELVNYVKDMGYTHVEFLPLAEHPFGGSWGYQVSGYFAPTSRLGHPDDLKFLINALHNAGIGVIMDWVPAHFPKDEFALARLDGTALYEHPDPRRGEHPDWGTYIFDFGRTEVRNFLVANACYWLEEFHVDGLRVDAVASMLYLDYSREDGQWEPNQYGGRENLEAIALLQEVNATCYKRAPGIVMIAEESTSFPGVTKPTDQGGLGFGFKWNMGWMHDSLEYLSQNPIYRQYHHHLLTFSMVYQYSENFVLPISHDEVVHGKSPLLRKAPGDDWQQAANLRAYLSLMWAHPGKQLLFMGSDFAQGTEWNENQGLPWWLLDYPLHKGVNDFVRDLNRVQAENPALYRLDQDPSGFRWNDADAAGQNTYVFTRFDEDNSPVVVAINFSPKPWHDFRIGLPLGGSWDEILNSDAPRYGGSGVGNLGQVHSEPIGYNGFSHSVRITLPPLGAVFFRPAK